MKKATPILISLTLVFATSTTLALDRSESGPAKPRIEVCFVMDTTGSMSGLIEGAKQKIWSIANEMIQAKPTPDLRLGLIGYRDRRDEYVLKTHDLTNDIDAVYANLKNFSAGGGGDMPESVNEALNEAVTKMSWSADRSVLKIIFLVGDAPPHMDYANSPQYPEVCQSAMKRDLIINTVQCGSIGATTPIWREIAKLSEGNYATIPQEGGMVAITTPMDEKLAELNRKLGGTLVAYGTEPTRREVYAKQAAAEAAPAAVAADRLAFNVRAGRAVQGQGELLDALAAGELKLNELKRNQLPPEWQQLDSAQLQAEITKKQTERAELQAQITRLNQERDKYLAVERKKLAAAAGVDSFDAQVNRTLHAQAAKKGISYSKE